MTGVSVVTVVRGRHDHLIALMQGLAAQSRLPDECVIAWMQDGPAALPAMPFPVRSVMVPGDPMPLAAARNRAVAAARGEQIIALDVDCIPAETLVARYLATADAADVRLGEIFYLPPGRHDLADRVRLGKRHPAKPSIGADEIRFVPDHGELWGLSFALSAAMWARAGGMDEAYVGYGAEETDFARRLAAAGATMAWIGGATAYHQHHAVHVPPLQHFDSILRNAALFRARWGVWCMDYWLGQFASMGLIDWQEDRIVPLRRPTDAERRASLRADLPFS